MNVIILGEDKAILDLVAHFMGIAAHDNINAAPSARVPRQQGPRLESIGPAVTGTCQARFADWPTGLQVVLPMEERSPSIGWVSSA